MSAKRPAAPPAANAVAWGGRFAGGPAEIMQRINVSIDFDKRLYAQDIAGSLAHCAMLVERRILSREDGAAIARGLEKIRAEIEGGSFPFRTEHEDIHLNIEARLHELVGAPAGRLHTARSRNDQVATDFKLWVRDAIDRLDRQIAGAAGGADRRRPRRHAATVMPGFTHLQVGAARDLRPSSSRLCRDAGARPRALCRCAPAAQRMPAGRRRARRHVVPDRPRRDGQGAGLRPAGGQFARRRLRPRFRARIPRRGGDRGDASVALRRGDRDLDERAVPPRPAERRLHHRQLDHAAEAQPRRGRAGARQGRRA